MINDCFHVGQQYITMFGGAIAFPFIYATAFCIAETDPARAALMSTMFLTSGVATWLQVTFGVRLPIIQGATSTLLVPTIAIMNLPQWSCKARGVTWQARICEIQGALIVGSAVETLAGAIGLAGLLVKYITPVTIAPMITLVGLSLFPVAADEAGKSWPIAIVTIILLVALSQYIPTLDTADEDKPLAVRWAMKISILFPILITVISMWFACAVLTWTNSLPKNHPGRVDGPRLQLIGKSEWLSFPLPFQWGPPTFTSGTIIGLSAGFLASILESIGDYYACAELCSVPPPTRAAMNRGITFEGLGCLLAGAWCWGGGHTSFSENIGAIGITRVASRRVGKAAAYFMIGLSLLGKFGALLATIPEPIIGGIMVVLFGIITSVGVSNLKYVDMERSFRNVFIFGFSVMVGMVVPYWVKSQGKLDFGLGQQFNELITILLSIGMLIGGLLAAFLDNTLPGQDRGSFSRSRPDLHQEESAAEVYALPYGLQRHVSQSCAGGLPIFDSYDPDNRHFSEGVQTTHV